jgi:DNA-binding MarR family transcriptional regulator
LKGKKNFKMTKRPRPADLYFRFLQLKETFRGQSTLPTLEPLEGRILELIAYASYKKERLSVKDLMGKRELASPATLHSRLKSMRGKGWIGLEETEDARRKQLVLTTAALTYFGKLSRLIVQAVKKSGLV